MWCRHGRYCSLYIRCNSSQYQLSTLIALAGKVQHHEHTSPVQERCAKRRVPLSYPSPLLLYTITLPTASLVRTPYPLEIASRVLLSSIEPGSCLHVSVQFVHCRHKTSTQEGQSRSVTVFICVAEGARRGRLRKQRDKIGPIS